MSGLEALSLVCSIMQVISFTKELATTCKDIYDGRATVDKITQENVASIKSLLDNMDQCSGAVQQCTQNEKDLHEIARKCGSAAQELQSEIQLITQYHKPKNAMKAFIGGIKSFTHKRKVQELSEKVYKYQKTLETRILVLVCTKVDASQIQQQSKFNELSTTMQLFISQIAAGHTEMADLINRHGMQTRQEIQQSETRVKNSINAVHVEADMEAQRNRLLQSLKFESMNSRRTGIKVADEATYASLFKSLESEQEPISGSAAAIWADFVNWLRSDDQAFWIQGKPGAGKSTLVKFLLQHENTYKALNEWGHDPLIISHFFWKPGSILQRNFRGLLCSLIHQLLSGEQCLVDQILSELKFTKENDSIVDWEVSQLIGIFKLISTHCNRPIFVLIDGVDEAAETEEILNFLTSGITLRNTKWCISSRNEEIFQQTFSKYKGFKLNEYTRDDMLNLASKEIQCALRNIQGYESVYTAEFVETLQCLIVDKAEGVYLWLVLALESIKRGLRHNDKKDVVLSRLRKLPTGLEALYADMWERLGEDKDIYQKEAANYFNLLIAHHTIVEEYNKTYKDDMDKIYFEWPLTLFQVMLTEDKGLQQILLNASHELPLTELEEKCSYITKSISIKTAGLLVSQEASGLQIYSPIRYEYNQLHKYATSKIEFIHRTLFDFLRDTEPGKNILAQSSVDLVYVRLATTMLCHLRIIESLHSVDFNILDPGMLLHSFRWLLSQAQKLDSFSNEWVLNTLLPAYETLFKAGLVPWDKRPKGDPRPCFDVLLLEEPAFEPFLKQRIESKGASYASCVLREYTIIKAIIFTRPRNIRHDILEFLFDLGADINSAGACFCNPPGRVLKDKQFTAYCTFESSLSTLIKGLYDMGSFTSHVYKMLHLVAFLERSPDLNAHTSFLLPVSDFPDYLEWNSWLNSHMTAITNNRNLFHLDGIRWLSLNLHKLVAIVITEVNLKCLVEFFLRNSPFDDPLTQDLITRAQQLVQREGSKAYSKARFLVTIKEDSDHLSDDTQENDARRCYQFINEDIDVFQKVHIHQYGQELKVFPGITIPESKVHEYLSACKEVDVSALFILLEQKLGICFNDATMSL